MYNMKICFLDKTIFQYNEDDKYSSKLRGAETILINLSIHLKNLGNEVTIYNNCPANSGKNWYNIELSSNDKTIYDVAIANADANLFNTIKAKKKIVISYSLQSIEKFIRKKQLLPYLKHRPTFFLIGKYHKNNRSKLTSLFGSKLLNLSVDDTVGLFNLLLIAKALILFKSINGETLAFTELIAKSTTNDLLPDISFV